MNTESAKKFMRLAIEEAKQSTEPFKCGVVIIKNGEIIAKAYNSQLKSNNVTAHAEIKAIGLAGQIVGNKFLDDCDIFCTCEPCIMCLAAITFAKIKSVHFGISLADVSPASRLINISIDDFLSKAPRKFKIIKNFLEDECRALICPLRIIP